MAEELAVTDRHGDFAGERLARHAGLEHVASGHTGQAALQTVGAMGLAVGTYLPDALLGEHPPRHRRCRAASRSEYFERGLRLDDLHAEACHIGEHCGVRVRSIGPGARAPGAVEEIDIDERLSLAIVAAEW